MHAVMISISPSELIIMTGISFKDSVPFIKDKSSSPSFDINNLFLYLPCEASLNPKEQYQNFNLLLKVHLVPLHHFLLLLHHMMKVKEYPIMLVVEMSHPQQQEFLLFYFVFVLF